MAKQMYKLTETGFNTHSASHKCVETSGFQKKRDPHFTVIANWFGLLLFSAVGIFKRYCEFGFVVVLGGYFSSDTKNGVYAKLWQNT